ncbi:MAG: hypothetical protein WA908_12175 [Pontixanthobacter sp.]
MKNLSATPMICAVATVLTACGPENRNAEDALSAARTSAAPSEAPTAPALAPQGDATDTGAERSEAKSDRFSSAYTKFAKDDCTPISTSPEASGGEFRCPGRGGIALFLQDGDLRLDLDAGMQNALFETTGPYNRIMDTIEWRMKDGEPFAIIFRYDVHQAMGPQPTTLAIEKIGRDGSPGCRVAHVAGSSPNANRHARQIADERATSFECGRNTPEIIGDATLTSLGGD